MQILLQNHNSIILKRIKLGFGLSRKLRDELTIDIGASLEVLKFNLFLHFKYIEIVVDTLRLQQQNYP